MAKSLSPTAIFEKQGRRLGGHIGPRRPRYVLNVASPFQGLFKSMFTIPKVVAALNLGLQLANAFGVFVFTKKLPDESDLL